MDFRIFASCWAACLLVACGSGGKTSAAHPPDAGHDAGGEASRDAPPSDAGDASDGEDGLPCDGTGVSKGPWSLHVDETSAVIRWETCRAGTSNTVTLTPEKSDASFDARATESSFVIKNTYSAALNPNATPDYAGTWYLHQASVTGLNPSTCYDYVLGQDSTRKGRVCTAHKPGEPFEFMAIADTNPGLTPDTAAVLGQIDPDAYEFTVHAGDMQYYASFVETWASWFPQMQPMFSHGAVFPCIGNHESEKPDEYQDYYLRFFGAAGFDGTDSYYRFESGGVWFFSLDTEQPLGQGSTQLGWFTQELKDASQQPGYRFAIVFLHRPLLTCGDTSELDTVRAALQPLFEQYGVPLVLQGHMHGYEHFEVPMTSDPSKTITYLTVAGGGGLIGDVNKNSSLPTCSMRVASGPYHFAEIVDVGASTLSGKAVGPAGQIYDTFQKTAP